ncbi:MAG TPA: aminopeptidase P family protein [Luteibaculaceae bacterium]|nr:aminopeptidase P family protein [Luteibaculaceae bacterium]
MKYLPIDRQLFIDNRQRFTKELLPKSIAIFNSNDIMPTNADGHMGFKQNADLFHLSGVDQEESILVLFPDAFNPSHREILFVRETNETIAVWEGAKLTKEQATQVSGVRNVQWLASFEKTLQALMAEAEFVYLNSNEHLRAHIEVETRDARFAQWIQKTYPLHAYKRSAPIMHRIRSVKHSIELDLIQQACDITEKGFRRLLSFVKPGVAEYEIEAELLHEFVRNRSKGFAYGPIIASGASACVLHYTENNKVCREGDVLLLDVAAEYANYASDLTRCIPVSGRFTERQRKVYDAVLRVKNAATQLLMPGVFLVDYHKEVGKLMESELLGLGLIDSTDIQNQNPDWPAYKKYFMHGTSHFLGLDVHDVGLWHEPIQAGNVFTVEPGIYIPEEGLGIRLENNVLVTPSGPIDLMKNIPIEAEEIEDLMQSR